jgi:hypothetical protein
LLALELAGEALLLPPRVLHQEGNQPVGEAGEHVEHPDQATAPAWDRQHRPRAVEQGLGGVRDPLGGQHHA